MAAAAVALVGDLMAEALAGGRDGVGALTTGPLARPDSEARWSARLAELLFPDELGAELIARTSSSAVGLRVRIAPSPALAQVPWELLPVAVPGGRRLLELAEVAYDPPATVTVGRVPAPAWLPGVRCVYVVDPGLEGRRDQVVPGASARFLAARWGETRWRHAVGRADLSTLLGADLEPGDRPGRFVYVGHASHDATRAGSAALRLSDPADVVGWARPVGRQRLLTALDLLRGTEGLQDRSPSAVRSDSPERRGDQCWPMPARVGLVACRSGGDHAAVETFGLVGAMIRNGAHLVTSTRWTLPTDTVFLDQALRRGLLEAPVLPTSALAIAVDESHREGDPVAHLAGWLRERWAAWSASGSPVDSPVFWASVTTHLAPRALTPPSPRP